MKIATKYSVGDVVYFVAFMEYATRINCLICLASGHVTIQGRQYDCPECGGCGNVSKIVKRTADVLGPVEIILIEIVLSEKNQEVRYMLGARSRRLQDESVLFRTHEEAEKFKEKHEGTKHA